MKKFLISVVILIAAYEKGSSQDLQYFISQAAENNFELQAKHYDFEAALKKVAISKSLPDPNLSIGAFILPVETRVGPQLAKLSLSQMVPWFGTLKAKGETNALLAESKYFEYLDLRNRIYMDVKSAYYPLAELDSKIRILENNIEILKTYKTISTSAFENNKGSLADILRVDLLIESGEIEIDILQEQRTPLIEKLNSITNTPQENLPTIVDSLVISDLEANFRRDSLLENNPRLNSFDKRIEAQNANQEFIRKDALPKLGFGVDYVIIGERSDINVPDNGQNALMPMVSISLPIYRKKYKESIAEAKLNQENLIASKNEYANKLQSQYSLEYYEASKSIDLTNLYDMQIAKAKQIKKLLLSEYSNSGESFLEILRLEQEILRYELAKVNAAKRFYVAVAKLEYMTHSEEL